jgi:type I restriction enzyme R subunit
VQTLSPLNRVYRDGTSVKDATYVVDFVNEPATVLEAFRQHQATAEAEAPQR